MQVPGGLRERGSPPQVLTISGRVHTLSCSTLFLLSMLKMAFDNNVDHGTHTLDKNAAHAWHTCAISADHAKHAFVLRMTDVDRATRAHVISMLTMARIHSMMMLIRCGIRVV